MNTYLLPIIILTSLGIGYKVFKTNNDSIKVVLVKFFLSLCALSVFCYVLLKIYQVPISYTKVSYAYAGWIPDSANKIDVTLIRNYDLLSEGALGDDQGEFIPSDIALTKKNKKSKVNGALLVSGLLKRDSVKIGYSSNISDESANKLRQQLLKGDTIREFPIDSINMIAYLSVLGNYRQSFFYQNHQKQSSLNYEKETTKEFLFYDGVHIKSDSATMHRYMNYSSLEPIGQNGFKLEYYATASQKDTICPIKLVFSTSNHERPNIFTTAEDISKTIEVIEFGGLKAGETHGCHYFIQSLTIDYRTPIALSSTIRPEPDEVTMHSIRYTDPKKISQIGMKGLRIYVTFPNLENVQALRIFIIAGIVGALAALMLRYLNILLFRVFRWARKKLSTRTKIIILILGIIVLLVAIFFSYKASNVDVFSIHEDGWLYK